MSRAPAVLSRFAALALAAGAPIALPTPVAAQDGTGAGRCVSNPYCQCTNCVCGSNCACGIDLDSPPAPRGGTSEYSRLNVALHARIPVQDFKANRGNDCWGYVAPSGREYALMGVNNAMAVVDITDPAEPIIVSLTPHNDSVWASIKVFGSWAYVSNESGGGVQVVDLSGVDSGVVRLEHAMTEDGLATAHTLAVDETSAFLYTCGSNLFGGGLVAYDLSNPARPAFAGAWSEAYVHEAQVVTYTEGPLAGRQIAFLFCGYEGLKIADVTDKSSMYTIAEASYPGASYTHQGWLSGDRRYLYINDELDEVFGNSRVTRTILFDVSDPENPVFVRTFSSGRPATDHNNYWWDGFLYQANYRSGLRVFNALETGAPQQVGYFDTFPPSDFAGFSGAWSCFADFQSKTVIVSDINSGLFILDASAARRINLNPPPPPPPPPGGPFGRRPGGLIDLPPFPTTFTTPEEHGAAGPPAEFPLAIAGPAQPLAGDLDLDGDVDAADLVMLLEDYGATESDWTDLDGDRSVGVSDLVTLMLHYGQRAR